MKPKKIKELQELATKMVGDGKNPNLFFVTDRGVTIMVTRSFQTAYSQWQSLAHRESALEDRKWGVIASVEPRDDGTANHKQLIIIDDSHSFLKHHKIT